MAIANTLTGLVPTMYRAMHTVSRENVGALPGATIDASGRWLQKIKQSGHQWPRLRLLNQSPHRGGA